MLNRMTAAILGGVAASLVFVCPPAMAQDEEFVVQAPWRPAGEDYEMRIERVSYRDLNLATPAGEQILQKRVGRAIRHVCLTFQNRSHGLSQSDHYRCTVGAWRAAWPQMNRAITNARQMAYNYRR